METPQEDMNFNISKLLKEFYEMNDDDLLIQATQHAELNMVQRTLTTTKMSLCHWSGKAQQHHHNFWGSWIAKLETLTYMFTKIKVFLMLSLKNFNSTKELSILNIASIENVTFIRDIHVHDIYENCFRTVIVVVE